MIYDLEDKHYIPIIGLEVHVELKTKSKMFCGCDANYFSKEPNTHCCPVCLGLPGALPVPNKKAVEWCILIGLALNCKIPETSRFDRKNYFYPDLPKGYQISQYDKPLCINGYLEIKSEIRNPKFETNSKLQIPNYKKIRIRRVHMEEDTGKLIHDKNGETLIDFNRSGVPLVEIVTEPDFRNSQEVDQYLRKIQKIVRYLDVTDAEMEKGTMRCEPSISMLKVQSSNFKVQNEITNDQLPKYRVEVKNINSFKFARQAIDYEIKRQTEILEKGGKVIQETRGWSESKNCTLPQRGKEEAKDYRYFPEPDIPPMRWSQNQISKIKNQIGELPDEKFVRFIKEYGLNESQAEILTERKEVADFYEAIMQQCNNVTMQQLSSVNIANYLINKKPDINKISPEELVKTISQTGQISQIGDEELQKIILRILKENQKAVVDFRAGKNEALQFLIGQVMREVKGKASPEEIRKQVQIQFHL